MKYENVAIGDKFIVSHRWKSAIAEVTAVTPKRFTVGGHTFAKKDGYVVGGDTYNRASIAPCTDEAIKLFMDKHHKNNLVRELERTNFKELTLETLEKIKSILDNKDNQ